MRLQCELRALAASCLVLGVVATAPSYAGVVYQNGAPNQSDSRLDDRVSAFFDLAQPFLLPFGGSPITDAHWWGNCANPSPPPVITSCSGDDSFEVSILSDRAGLPGALVATLLTKGNANRAATGLDILGSYTEYEYSTSFAPVALTLGTQYWFEISDFVTTGGAWYMEGFASPGHSSAFRSTGTGGAWATFPNESFNLRLTNDGVAPAPEPATLALFAIGLVGLAASRRRKLS